MNHLLDLGLTPKMPTLGMRQKMVVTALDIGSFKVACVIAQLKPVRGASPLPGRSHTIEVLGMGYVPSKGIKNGYVVDFDAAESAVRMAVDKAEKESGFMVKSVIVNASCGRPSSSLLRAESKTHGRVIGERDIQNLLSGGIAHAHNDDQALLHALPLGYKVDEQSGVRDPVGMKADCLASDLHLLKAEKQPLNNLLTLLHRCHLDVTALVSTPYASALASLIEDEAEIGVACLDFGAGTTTLGVFIDGQLIHVDGLSVGGNNISLDLARELGLSLQSAERLKTLYGSALAMPGDVTSTVPVEETQVGNELISEVSRFKVDQIIQSRCEEILTTLRTRLSRSGFSGQIARRVIITGGSAELTGLADVTQQILQRPVRLARPLGVAGLNDMSGAYSFSTVVGLLTYPQIARHEYHQPLRYQKLLDTHQSGYFDRVVGWFRDSF